MRPIRYLFAGLSCAFALPAAIGLLDSWVWVMTGERLSWIKWQHDRVAVAWVFLFVALVFALAAIQIRDAADR